MKAKEVFALLIRVIGVLGLAYVIHNVVNQLVFGNLSPSFGAPFVKEVMYLLIGIYFLWGAPLVVKFAYSAEPAAPAAKPGP